MAIGERCWPAVEKLVDRQGAGRDLFPWPFSVIRGEYALDYTGFAESSDSLSDLILAIFWPRIRL